MSPITPGCLVVIVPKPDSPLTARQNLGKVGLVIKNLTESDGIYSSPNIWGVLIDGRCQQFHALDLTVLDGDE